MAPTRRTVLKYGVVGGATGVAGCNSSKQWFGEPAADSPHSDRTVTETDAPSDVAPDGWHVRPDSAPETLSERFACPDEVVRKRCEDTEETPYDSAATCERVARRFRQVPDEDGIEWGTTSGGSWTLFVDGVEYRRGEDIEIRLSGSDHRGVDFMYDLQVFTTEGWENLRYHAGWRPGRGFNDIMRGGPARWTLRFLDDGFEITFYEGRTETNRPFVCPEPPAGRYRFVYWGTCDTESEPCNTGETGLAVAFDLVD